MKTPTAQPTMSTILRGIANERWPLDETEPEDSTQAWAGECGLFVDAAWGPLERAGFSFSDEGMISKFSDLTCIVNPPRGLSLAEVRDFGIERHINHHWLTSGGRHFDASCPDGVDSLFDLRGIRQTAVEVLRRDQPKVLERLCREHHWWRESVELFDEFLQVRFSVDQVTRV